MKEEETKEVPKFFKMKDEKKGFGIGFEEKGRTKKLKDIIQESFSKTMKLK